MQRREPAEAVAYGGARVDVEPPSKRSEHRVRRASARLRSPNRRKRERLVATLVECLEHRERPEGLLHSLLLLFNAPCSRDSALIKQEGPVVAVVGRTRGSISVLHGGDDDALRRYSREQPTVRTTIARKSVREHRARHELAVSCAERRAAAAHAHTTAIGVRAQAEHSGKPRCYAHAPHFQGARVGLHLGVVPHVPFQVLPAAPGEEARAILALVYCEPARAHTHTHTYTREPARTLRARAC